MRVKVKRALLSVWDKTGLTEFARGLNELGIELVSSGKLRPELVTSDVAAIDDAPRAIEQHMRGGATKTILAERA